MPPKESGVGTSGVCKRICWRERRRAIPYLLPHPSNLADSLCGHFPLWCRQPPPPQSPRYEELLEVMTRAVLKLKIDWPAEEQAEPQTSRLDECFLRAKRSPPTRSLAFFPNLHTKVSRSWARPFSAHTFIPTSDYYGNMVCLDSCSYKAMPLVEQMLASYLSTDAASSLKVPYLPSMAQGLCG